MGGLAKRRYGSKHSGATRSFTGAASHTSGTLTVTNGASLTLAGSYVTSNFAAGSDGAGGTCVKFAMISG